MIVRYSAYMYMCMIMLHNQHSCVCFVRLSYHFKQRRVLMNHCLYPTVEEEIRV